jgi:hypothetical protein
VSTARGGESSAFEPGLEHVIGALTASGHPHELAGREAALAAFRAASRQPTPARSARSARHRGPLRIALPARLAVAAAAVIAVLGGLTAAAAAQVLPPQVQRIAYSVLAPLGVPVSQPTQSHADSGQPSPVTGPASGHGGCPCPSGSAPSAGSATPQHTPKAKAKVKAKAKKSNAKPVLTLVSRRLLNDRLIVTAHSGRPGDSVKLTEWTGAAWTTVASAPLRPGLRAVFVLPVKTAAGHLFRAEVLEGASHAAVASNRLWIPHVAATGAKVIRPSPTASPVGTGTPTTPTPTPTPTLTSTTTAASSPTPSASPSGTGSPTTTPTPDPSASATAPATSAPPQTPNPSTSSSTAAVTAAKYPKYRHYSVRSKKSMAKPSL